MKLRIQDDSLRLRLTRGEVDDVSQGRAVKRTIHFTGGRTLQYIVTGSAADASPRAVFSGDAIRVSLPESRVKAWAASDEVGIEGQDGAIRILVEKDFQCLHPDALAEPGAFPNPLAG
ncbi:MAG TPA: hypothetical protein VFT60_07145 [Bryobacteraceae bacterium]|jgi:hypothetical protein|nr:hypothetical protein [Bryobacteraceae bacterium]